MTANGTTALQTNDPFPGLRFKIKHSCGFFYLKIASNRKIKNIKRKENKSPPGIHKEEPVPVLYLKFCLCARKYFFKEIPHTIR